MEVNNTKKNIKATVRRADFELELFNDELPIWRCSTRTEAMLKRDSIRWGNETRGKRGKITVKETESD